MNLSTLCAAQWTTYLLDGAVAIFFIVAMLVCGSKGFFSCILGIVSSLVAVVLAITLASVVREATGGLFGLEGTLTETFHEAFLKVEGFNVDVSTTGVEAALKEQDVTAILAQLVLKSAEKQETIAAGTTLALLLGEATASLATTLITGILLFIVVKLVVRLAKKILNGIADGIKPVGWLNTLLGLAYGALYALTIVSVILAILAVFPSAGISAYLSNTLFVGALFEHNPLVYVLSWFI